MKKRILFAGPEAITAVAMALAADFEVRVTNSPHTMLQLLKQDSFDIIILEPAGLFEVPDNQLYYYSLAKMDGKINDDMALIFYTKMSEEALQPDGGLFHDKINTIEWYMLREPVGSLTSRGFKERVAKEKNNLKKVIGQFFSGKTQ